MADLTMEERRKKVTEKGAPKFNVGDHVSCYDNYWGRFTGVIEKPAAPACNVDGPGKDNYIYWVKIDLTGNVQWFSEKKIKKCRKSDI